MFHFYMFQSTFYVYCLTSGLFRKEFYNIIRCNRRQRVGVVTRATQTRTQKFRIQERRNQQQCKIETKF